MGGWDLGGEMNIGGWMSGWVEIVVPAAGPPLASTRATAVWSEGGPPFLPSMSSLR